MNPRFNDHPFALGRRGGAHRGRGRGHGHGWGAGMAGMPPMRRRGRRGRGDVRIAVPKLLAERPMHGYEAIQEIDQRSSGAWKPSPGAIYPTLQLLEDEGLITPAESEGKKVFSLTDAGHAAAEELAAQPAPWDTASAGLGDGEASLRQSAFQLMSAAREIGTVGTGDQQQQAVAILDEARRKLYGMLAADPTADPADDAGAEDA